MKLALDLQGHVSFCKLALELSFGDRDETQAPKVYPCAAASYHMLVTVLSDGISHCSHLHRLRHKSCLAEEAQATLTKNVQMMRVSIKECSQETRLLSHTSCPLLGCESTLFDDSTLPMPF